MPTRTEWRNIIRARWPFLWRGAVAIAILIGIIAAWEVYSLEDYTDIHALLALGGEIRHEVWAIPATLALFIGAGVTFLPLTVMVVATIILFGALEGFLIALAGPSRPRLWDTHWGACWARNRCSVSGGARSSGWTPKPGRMAQR